MNGFNAAQTILIMCGMSHFAWEAHRYPHLLHRSNTKKGPGRRHFQGNIRKAYAKLAKRDDDSTNFLQAHIAASGGAGITPV